MHFVVAVLAVFNGNILVDLSEKVNIVQVYFFTIVFFDNCPCCVYYLSIVVHDPLCYRVIESVKELKIEINMFSSRASFMGNRRMIFDFSEKSSNDIYME